MQLPPDDELVLVSGCPPVRANKARYYEDRRLKERVLPPPQPEHPIAQLAAPDDWTGLPAPPSTKPRSASRKQNNHLKMRPMAVFGENQSSRSTRTSPLSPKCRRNSRSLTMNPMTTPNAPV